MLVWLSISIQRLLAELRDSSLRYLASTSPHHRILKSYRRAVEVEEAAKLPLDDGLDSAVSDHSRASTTGWEEKGRLWHTYSIASSVTSDWDNEVGNQENKHNPNRRKKRNILGSNFSFNSLP